MSDETALVPIDERDIDFYGDEITTALVKVESQTQIYVPLRPICKYLGLSWSGQSERIKRDPVLSEEARFVRVSRTARGGNPELLCLPLEFLNGWLFGVSPTRVKPELKDKVVRYQRECYRVLWQSFQAEASAVVDVVEASPSASVVALEHIRDMGLAIARMAEQQLEMEHRLTSRLDRAAKVVGDIQRRLGVVERKLYPPALITDDQAEEVSASVKALAELITSKDPSKNHYQGIFAELYRRFGVSSYKNIRLDHYEKVLQFLEEWRQATREK
jgi:P22_AR N-terminal domain/ORF6C domain